MTVLSLSDLLPSLLRSKRDWFVVEQRCCFSKRLCEAAFSDDFGFGIVLPNRYNLTIDHTGNNSARSTDKEGQTILIGQTVFENLEAAQVYFEKLSSLGSSGDSYDKLYVWRIVARSRDGAVTLPPAKYSTKDGVLLRVYPEHLRHKPTI